MAVFPPPRVLNAASIARLGAAGTGLLRAAGFDVKEVNLDSLHRLTGERPDLIVVPNTPNGEGLQVCSQLKNDPATASIPIICVSDTARDAREAVRVLDGGADAYVVEPVHPENLVATVRALLRLSRAERFSEALNRVNAVIGSTLDFEQIMQRVVVEATREIGTDSACIFLLEHGEWVVKYSNGLPQFVGARFPDRPNVPGSITAEARQNRPYVISPNSALPQDERETLERNSIRRKVLVPLRVRGELIGLIGFHHHTDRDFDALQIDFAGKLGAAVSLALENARLYQEAAEGRKLLDAFMRHIPHGIAIADAPGGRFRMVSQHGQEMTGLGREAHESILGGAAIGPFPWRLFRPGSDVAAQPSEVPLMRAIRDGSAVTNEEWILETPGGLRIPILVDAGPIRDSEGRVTGGVVAWQDISVRKRLEQELLNARQMEATGMLAGGIAHEFNNMLTVITGHSHLLLESSRSKKVREHILPVLDAASRLASLTSELLGFAGRQLIHPAPVSLNATVERMAGALRPLLGDGYVLKTELEPYLGKIKVDVSQMEHIIVSLILHARDSMPDGGTIAIRTSNVEIRKEEIECCCQVEPGKYALLSVSNTGPGLDRETVERLFEPFFGSEGIGKGASLALSATYGAVKQNRGGIGVISEAGKGTRIQICLPHIPEN